LLVVRVLQASPLFRVVIRPPPPPTLFPYTTLFRSRLATMTRLSNCAGGQRRRRSQQYGSAPCRVAGAQLASSQTPVAAEAAPAIDRKSTRLNSSHVKISYAVFCLKKKTTQENGG